MTRRLATVLMGILVLPLSAVEERDAVLLAAHKALANGQALSALQVLHDHPAQDDLTEVRLLQARALMVLGRHTEAGQRLGMSTVGLEEWPERTRAQVAALVGEITLANGSLAAARPWLEQALRLPGDGVGIDRTLVLLAECCERSGDHAAALRYAHIVWRDWLRSPFRAQAGVLEARLLSASHPDDARALLAGVRALDAVEPGTRLSAAELLCQLLLLGKPGQCLVVAEQELPRLSLPGRLPLYRALALAALDPREGVVALEHLDRELRDEPAARSAWSRLHDVGGVRQDAAMRLERARAELELGRTQSARLMLEPLVASQPAALILMSSIPDVKLEQWLDAPAMNDAAARAAVAMALARRGDHQRAWPLFAPLVGPSGGTPGIPQASLLYWASQSAQTCSPTQVPELIQRMLELDNETGDEIGMTWATEAQRRERAGALPRDIQVAWERAGLALPTSHPWQPICILRAAKPLVADGKGLESARRLLERVSGSAESDDQQRCQFLLAQVYERLGRIPQALQVVGQLRSSAGTQQAEKLDRMQARLAEASTSEVQKRPLDAEN